MIEYKVIVESTTQDAYFSKKVADLLNQGWVLEGSLVVAGTERSCYLAQALIREVENQK
jgi:hypothetical protein